MIEPKANFGQLFKKFRLRSGFYTLSEFCNTLAEKGFIFEESLFSHWQRNTRVPKDRKLLIALLNLFLERGGISSINDMNIFMESVNQGYLTEQEIISLTRSSNLLSKTVSPQKIFGFLNYTIKSKQLKRSGWVREKIKKTESVAEHSFQLSIMAMVLADQLGVDRERLIEMAIVHDLGEVITGDIVWSRGKIMDIEQRIKKEMGELEGIIKIFKVIDKSHSYRNIFEEMIERKSLEAKIFWQLDKLEMAIQALEYEKENNIKLDEFFINADLQITSPLLRKIFELVLDKRPKNKRKK